MVILRNYSIRILTLLQWRHETFLPVQESHILSFHTHINFSLVSTLLHPFLKPWLPYYALNFYNFIISRMLFKWNNTAYKIWGLTFFIHHNSLEIHPGCWLYQWLTPLYRWEVICYGHTNFFNYLIMERYLWWLSCQFMTIMNKAAINICVQVFVWHLQGECPGMQLLCNMVVACLVF